MFHSRIHIEVGDLVIVFLSRDSMSAITITPGDFFHNKYGRYAHDDMVGMKYGSKMHSPPPQPGYIHILRPTPELWTLSLPHRTQILYLPDIAYITMKLGVRPGGTVIEAGTGSGSMTHALSRSVGSIGKVRSFEYHRPRFEKARDEFASHKVGNIVLNHRNVCKDGFGPVTDAEAVFLDVPAPWEAVPHAVRCFRPDVIARICCFSPCLEQVLKTVAALRAEGYSDIYTQEVLNRSHELVPPPLKDAPRFRTITSIVDHLATHETRKEARRLLQMKTARDKARRKKEAEIPDAVVSEEQIIAEDGFAKVTSDRHPARAGESATGTKRKLADVDDSSDDVIRPGKDIIGALSCSAPADQPEAKVEKVDDAAESKPSISPPGPEPDDQFHDFALTRPASDMRGHTSYLTFACFYPASIRERLAAQDEPSMSRATPLRVAQLGGEAELARAGSQETEYGSDGLDEVMGTLTEEEMLAMGV